MNQLMSRQEDAIAFNLLPHFPKSHFLPWTESAMRPSSLLVILNEVTIHNRSVIVECGSGISTLYLSLLCAGTNKKVISIDHDAAWQKIVAGQAESLGISLASTQFIAAPMKPCAHSPFGLEWYDTEVINKEMPDAKIDLLLVDGPLAYHAAIAKARYPALPFFRSRMADDFVVFLDDCNRAGEREIAQLWSKAYALTGQIMQMRGNVCMLHPPQSHRYNVY
jgi:hypothetical protein